MKFLKSFQNLFTRKSQFPSNILVTAAHGSSKIPLTVFPSLASHYQISPRLLLNYSDYGTKYLTKDIPEKQRVIPRYGRIIGDPNRAKDAPDIIRFEDFGGMKIFRPKFEKKLTQSWIRKFHLHKLLKFSYEPFHREIFEKIQQLVDNPENESKPIILIDVHDTGNRILGRTWQEDTTRKEGKMPEIVISSAPDEQIAEDQFGTAPNYLVQSIASKLEKKLDINPSEVEINTLFLGGHITRFFGNPSKNKQLRKILQGRQIFAIQVEFNRSLYLDEVTQRPYLWKTRAARNALMEVLTEIGEMNF